MEVIEIVVSVASITAAAGAFAIYLGKQVIGNLLARDLAEFKERFSRLNEERARAIRELYELITEVEAEITQLLYVDRPQGLLPSTADEQEVIGSVRELELLVGKREIFFDDEACVTLRRVSELFSASVTELENRRLLLEANVDRVDVQVDKLAQSAFNLMKDEVPEAKNMLKAEFRRLMGA